MAVRRAARGASAILGPRYADRVDELTVTVLAGTVPAGTVPLGTAPGDPDGSDLISLHAWLTQSAETRGLPVVLRRREPGPGAMPGVDLVDALVTTVSDKAVMAAVASGVAGWV